MLLSAIVVLCGSCSPVEEPGRQLPGLRAIFNEDPGNPLSVQLTSSNGNAYAVFARHDLDNRPVQLLQIQTTLPDGAAVVDFSDEQSRPIRFEAPNETAEVIYQGDRARILYTDPDGEESVIDVDLVIGEVTIESPTTLPQFRPRETPDTTAQRTIDRFDVCRLLDPHYQIVEQLFACPDDDDAPHCAGDLALAASAAVEICDSSLEITEVDDLGAAADSELIPIELDVVATAFVTPTHEGTIIELAATGLSEALPGSYSWAVLAGPTAPAIPDGQTSEVVLDRPGAYRVEVAFDDADGQSATARISISVETITPVAHAGDDQLALIDQAVEFDGSASFDPDGTIILYEWDYGDGTADSGLRVRHQFADDGDKVVTLTVTDNDGLTATDTITVDVTDTPGFILSIEAIGGGATTPPEGDNIVSRNTVVQIVASPAIDWRFDHFEGDASGANPTITIFVNRNMSVIAVFEPLDDQGSGGGGGEEEETVTLTVESNPSQAGIVVLNPSGGLYPVGTRVELFAIPAPGFVFSAYSGAANGSNPIAQVTVDQDLSVVATFTADDGGMSTSVTQQPVSVTAPCPGLDAEFNILVDGTVLGFTWQRDCEPDGTFEETIVPGPDFDISFTSTTSILTVLAADAGDECNYRCLVTAVDGVLASDIAAFTIIEEPRAITVHPTPADLFVCPSADVEYTVAAVGVGPLSYQWRKDDFILGGETGDTLTLNDVQVGDSGSYTCDVTDDCGTMTSDPAVLNVAGLQFEAGTIADVDGTGADVNLVKTYCSPVIVCTVEYANNTNPVVARVRDVSGTGFHVRLQNPGDDDAVVAETVHYIVMEEGAWTLDGVNFEAQRTTSTLTDSADVSYVGQQQTYLNTYTEPVVIGQVMTENAARWSVFWCRGIIDREPPDASTLFTGKHVGQDTDVDRSDELIGFIVFEAGHSTISGVNFEAALGDDKVRGIGNSPPYDYNFNTAFGAAPAVAVLSQAAMDGNDGSWSYLLGTEDTKILLVLDEDQIKDPERAHGTEQVGYVVFESNPVRYPP